MQKKNFNVGDRIIVVHVERHQGEKGVITGKNLDTVSGKLDNGKTFTLFDWKLELEDVYNSPLYKALR